jgi:L-threonylcarbamoyladenylate synthase
MKTEVLRIDHPVALEHAQDILQHGGLVAFPTDTIYGLAATMFTVQSIEQLYIARGSSSSNSRAVSILISSLDELSQITVKMSPMEMRLAEHFWPGQLTLVLPAKKNLPLNLLQEGNVGVRMPDHPAALALLRKTGPLAVTAANLAGQDYTYTAQDVLKQMKGRVHLVLDGMPQPQGLPSTIVECAGETLVVLRRGSVTEERVRQVLQAA